MSALRPGAIGRWWWCQVPPNGRPHADCFAAALAKQKNAELITGDPEFKAVAGQVKIAWLPQS